MARYASHDLILDVEQVEEGAGKDLDRLLRGLSWTRARASAGMPSLALSVRSNDNGLSFPPTAREVLRADGFRGLESGGDFYLTDGASLLHLEPSKGRGEARLAPSFFSKPAALRQSFWAFALLKLLRGIGIHSLHAAGLVSEGGVGVLVVAESGSGKSTLAVALVRKGWRYLSDDAVLLRSVSDGVEALALRRHFYVDSSAAGRYADLPLCGEVSDRAGGRRRRLAIEVKYPDQRVAACRPGVLLFPRILPRAGSVLIPLDRASALGRLIAQSGPQLFDRETMAQHLTVLKTLVHQTRAYELEAGRDLYQEPMTLDHLLTEITGDTQCLASS